MEHALLELVTVSASNDDDALNGTATFAHTASSTDIEYHRIQSPGIGENGHFGQAKCIVSAVGKMVFIRIDRCGGLSERRILAVSQGTERNSVRIRARSRRQESRSSQDTVRCFLLSLSPWATSSHGIRISLDTPRKAKTC